MRRSNLKATTGQSLADNTKTETTVGRRQSGYEKVSWDKNTKDPIHDNSKARNSLIRRSTVGPNAHAVPRSTLRKRRSTYCSTDFLTVPVPELGQLQEAYVIQESSAKMRNYSQGQISASSGTQASYGSRTDCSMLDNEKPKRDMRKDSLWISQPAPRLRKLACQSEASSDAPGYSYEQAKQQPPKSSGNVRFSENPSVKRDNASAPELTAKAGVDFFELIQSVHLAQIHHPVQPAALSAKKQLSRPSSSVDDNLIANLCSAWYWSGYYAGYHQSLAEE